MYVIITNGKEANLKDQGGGIMVGFGGRKGKG